MCQRNSRLPHYPNILLYGSCYRAAYYQRAIAAELIPFERTDKLFPPNQPNGHWYEDFFNILWTQDDCSLINGKNITILTFNYDRSLEYYLYTVAKTRSNLTSGVAATFEITSKNRMVIALGPTIIHLHGQLGNLLGNVNIREYSFEQYPESVRIAADGLQLLSEANPDSEEFVMAREAIKDCKRLYFFGFGFHPVSVKRLADFSDKDFMKGKSVSGTCTGFSPTQWARVNKEVLFDYGGDFYNKYQSVSEYIKNTIFDRLILGKG